MKIFTTRWSSSPAGASQRTASIVLPAGALAAWQADIQSADLVNRSLHQTFAVV